MSEGPTLLRSASAWRRANDAFATMPVVALGAVLAWLAFGQGGAGREAGAGTIDHVESPGRVLSAPPSMPMLVIAVGPERAEQLRDLLSGEANLRAALGEELRLAEVISGANSEDAERIAEAVRTELVLGQPLLVLVAR